MSLEVTEDGRRIAFTFEDLMRYHGAHSPAGVAMAYKVLERALPRLGPEVPRRTITIRTAFGGPGARDGFELVTRAVTEGRYVVDESLARPELGIARERFVFVVGAITLVLRDGFVSERFIELARADPRSAEQEQRLTVLKHELADRVMAAPAPDVYDIVE